MDNIRLIIIIPIQYIAQLRVNRMAGLPEFSINYKCGIRTTYVTHTHTLSTRHFSFFFFSLFAGDISFLCSPTIPRIPGIVDWSNSKKRMLSYMLYFVVKINRDQHKKMNLHQQQQKEAKCNWIKWMASHVRVAIDPTGNCRRTWIPIAGHRFLSIL